MKAGKQGMLAFDMEASDNWLTVETLSVNVWGILVRPEGLCVCVQVFTSQTSSSQTT